MVYHVGLTAPGFHSLCVSLAGKNTETLVVLISVSLRCATIEGGNHRCRSVNFSVGLHIKFAGGDFEFACVASAFVQVR